MILVAYLVDTKPSAAATRMIDMFTWKVNLLVTAFILHLANHTPVHEQGQQVKNQGPGL